MDSLSQSVVRLHTLAHALTVAVADALVDAQAADALQLQHLGAAQPSAAAAAAAGSPLPSPSDVRSCGHQVPFRLLKHNYKSLTFLCRCSSS
jgi:hypothetical protein